MKNIYLAIATLSILSCGKKEEKVSFSYEPAAKETTVSSETSIQTSIDTTTTEIPLEKNDSPKEVSEKTAKIKVDNGPTEINLTTDDAMKFNLKEIKVKAGKKVKLTLKHLGKMPKMAMGHNFVLLKQGVDIKTFGIAAAKSKSTEFIPDGGKDVIAQTKLIGGGESSTIEFDAPAPGTYDFVCSFPGHFAIMRGKFVVE